MEETEKGNDMEGSERRSLGEVDIDQSVAATVTQMKSTKAGTLPLGKFAMLQIEDGKN